MITELVLFDLPKGITREQVVAGMRERAQHWRRCPDESWRQRIRELYGSEPVMRHFDTRLVVDNVLEDSIEPTEV